MRSNKYISTIFGILSAIIPTTLYTNYVIYYFYTGRATLLDVGWFSYLSTHSLSWSITNPPVLYSAKTGGSFLTTHISPFFHLLSILYEKLLSFIPQDIYFALFIGICYGVISLSIFIAGVRLLPKVNMLYLLILTLISILTSFNGASLALIGFPHIEIAIAAFILLFISLYFSGYKKLSIVPLIFLLLIREDAGFHLFALLMMILLIQLLYLKSIKRLDYTLMLIAIFSFIYSLTVIYIQKHYFPGDNALVRIYLGKPIFSHLSADFMKHRLNFIIHNREYLYIPALATLILSLITRNIFLLASLLATTPWIALSLVAITYMPGSLSNYYIFPLIITLSWPIPAFLIYRVYIDEIKNNQVYILASVILITLLSTTLFPNNKGNADNAPWRGFYFTKIQRVIDTQKLLVIIKTNKKYLGNILFGEGISAFVVDTLQKKEYGYLNHFSKAQIKRADTVIYYLHSGATKPAFDIMKKIIKQRDMKYIYLVKDTDIVIASRFDLSNILSSLLLKRLTIDSI